MNSNLLVECIKTSITSDQKEPLLDYYIEHSYDVYLDYCYNEGYEPLSSGDYYRQILTLDEDLSEKIKKALKIASGVALAGATGYAALKGVNFARKQAKVAGDKDTNLKQDIKNAYYRSGSAKNFIKNSLRTSLNQDTAEEQLKGSKTEYGEGTHKNGQKYMTQKTTVARKKDIKDVNDNNNWMKAAKDEKKMAEHKKYLKDKEKYDKEENEKKENKERKDDNET